jgi:hypothetical protein
MSTDYNGISDCPVSKKQKKRKQKKSHRRRVGRWNIQVGVFYSQGSARLSKTPKMMKRVSVLRTI